MIKKLPTTDRKIITDYRHVLFVSRKKSILHFFSRKQVTSLNLWLIRRPNGKNFLFFLYRYIATANIKITKSHLKDATDFIDFIETTKVKKPNVSSFGPRNA